MNRKETEELQGTLYDIYTGLLKNAPLPACRGKGEISYALDCPEYAQFREKYRLEAIAGRGGDRQRALRLLHYFAPRLAHKGDYDNHVPCNALDLLEYALERPDQGINCLNKSKILQECCLAVGIYARRVHLRPCSPYDFDCHVVTEVWDRSAEKWIMLDCTTNGFWIDAQGTPLDCLEMRSLLADQQPCSVVYPRQRRKNMAELMRRNAEANVYYAKNLFYLGVDSRNAFGEEGNRIFYLTPEGFDIRANAISGQEYRIRRCGECSLEPEFFQRRMERARTAEYEKIGPEALARPPVQ